MEPDPNLPPGGRQDVVVVGGPGDTIEGRRLVGLVDDADRHEDEAGSDGNAGTKPIVEVQLLKGDFATWRAALQFRVLDLELGAEGEAVGERVAQEDDEPLDVRRGRPVLPGRVGIVDLAVSADGGPLLAMKGRPGAADDHQADE